MKISKIDKVYTLEESGDVLGYRIYFHVEQRDNESNVMMNKAVVDITSDIESKIPNLSLIEVAGSVELVDTPEGTLASPGEVQMGVYVNDATDNGIIVQAIATYCNEVKENMSGAVRKKVGQIVTTPRGRVKILGVEDNESGVAEVIYKNEHGEYRANLRDWLEGTYV